MKKLLLFILFFTFSSITSSAQKIKDAVKNHDKTKVEKYLKGGRFGKKDLSKNKKLSYSLMSEAIHNNDDEIVKLLLEYKASTNYKYPNPLHYAINIHHNPALVEILLKNNADPNETNLIPNIPIITAARNVYNTTQMLKLLISDTRTYLFVRNKQKPIIPDCEVLGSTFLHIIINKITSAELKEILNLVKKRLAGQSLIDFLNIENDEGVTAIEIVHKSYQKKIDIWQQAINEPAKQEVNKVLYDIMPAVLLNVICEYINCHREKVP